MLKRPIVIPLIALILLTLLVDALFPTIILRNHYTKHLDQSNIFKYLIIDSPKECPETYSYLAKIIGFYDTATARWLPTDGKIKIYIKKNNVHEAENKLLNYGDVIVSSADITPIKNFPNSGFNYVRYMRHKRIYDQTFINSYQIIAANQGNKLIALAKQTNKTLQSTIQSTAMGDDQKDLACALLLGNKKDLAPNIRSQFNTSGLAHILCVSGLHIMLIILAINFIIKALLPRTKLFFIMRKAVCIFICWAIAFIVGLTPSAIRVAVMLCLLIASNLLIFTEDRLNILYITAFIFLCFDPLVLFNISFQLSFLAVLGLIVVRPYLMERFSPNIWRKSYFTQGIVSNIFATTSAQVFTLPIILVNFGKFPVMFLLSNLIVVPLMQLILISLIALLIFSSVPQIQPLLTDICNTEMTFLLSAARLFDTLTP